MQTTLKIVKWALLVILVLLMCLAGVAYYWLRATLPGYDGERKVKGLSAPVRIVRDSWGMPHIFAGSDEDASFALGYCMAQDRLFQMDLLRRTVRGRLAEILGERLVEYDTLFRTLTAKKPLEAVVAEFPPEVASVLEAYTAGVNAYLDDPGGPLPVEFFLLGYEPDPWEVPDCAAAYYYMAYGLSFTIETELLFAAIVDRVGPGLAGQILIDYPEGYPVTLAGGTGLDFVRTATRAREMLGFSELPGSNNWVIAGAKSVTGKPLLANDMHLGHSMPGIWYEAHLVTPGANVSGVVVPGMPGIVVGANEHVAWGFTNSMADDTDYYLERRNPDNPGQVEFEGKWEDIRVEKQTIEVKDGAPVDIGIRLTRHGPVVVDEKDRLISLRWAASELPAPALALYLANRARNIDELEAALGHFKCPGQNWVYADDRGHIGYWAAVGIPVREGFDGVLPLPGWDGKHEWKGFVPTGEQPHFRDPPRGFIATANNKITGDDYPHVISKTYATPDRIIRIVEMLTAKDKLGADDFMKMHADVTVVLAREWVPILLRSFDGLDLAGSEKVALDLLKSWDFVAGPESNAASIFFTFMVRLADNVLRPRLGNDLYAEFGKGRTKYSLLNGLRSLVSRGESAWFDDPGTPGTEKLADVMARSFREAVAQLAAEAGDDPGGWTWGDLHTVTFHHPFGRFSPLAGAFFDAGPFPAGGGISTVNPAPFPFGVPRVVRAGASQRMIIDFADRRRSLRVLPAGISGNFMSPHYDDQVVLWRNVAYRPFLLSREEVEADARHELKLLPE